MCRSVIFIDLTVSVYAAALLGVSSTSPTECHNAESDHFNGGGSQFRKFQIRKLRRLPATSTITGSVRVADADSRFTISTKGPES
ncbi:hypothetical protein NDU88_008344 [Pleurodeles waltl]|uniref:Secreted protein n=1 Tax=Pleurodeles waltl TaxID=8319 RepID=A0AAV7P018_PLEWA|nr:hypothetical protein NDU88_008344 [Pleurodeles waltl]